MLCIKLFARKRNQRSINIVLVALLVIGTFTASVPFLFAEKAHADTAVAVSSFNAQGWITVDMRTNGSVSFVADSTTYVGGSADRALSMTTDANPCRNCSDLGNYRSTTSP